MSNGAGLQDRPDPTMRYEILWHSGTKRTPKKEEAGIDFEDAESTIRQPSPQNISCKPYILVLLQTDYKSDAKLKMKVKNAKDSTNEKPKEGKATSPRFGYLRNMSSKKKKHDDSKKCLAKCEHNPRRSMPTAEDPGDDININSFEIPDERKVLTTQDSITIEARRTPKPDTMVHIDAEARPHNPVASELLNTRQDAVDTSIDEVGYETPDDEKEQEDNTHKIAQRDPAHFSDATHAKKKCSITTCSATLSTPDRQQENMEGTSPRPGIIGTNFSSSSPASSPRPSSDRHLSSERNYTVRERHGTEWQKLHDMFDKNHGGSVPKLFDAPASPRSYDGYTKSKATVGEIDSEHIKSVKEIAKELNAKSPKRADDLKRAIGDIDMTKLPPAPTLAQ